MTLTARLNHDNVKNHLSHNQHQQMMRLSQIVLFQFLLKKCLQQKICYHWFNFKTNAFEKAKIKEIDKHFFENKLNNSING